VPGRSAERDGCELLDTVRHRAGATGIDQRRRVIVDEPQTHGERAELEQSVLQDRGRDFVARNGRAQRHGQAAQRSQFELGHGRMLGSVFVSRP
jgi:hypothetical protein